MHNARRPGVDLLPLLYCGIFLLRSLLLSSGIVEQSSSFFYHSSVLREDTNDRLRISCMRWRWRFQPGGDLTCFIYVYGVHGPGVFS